LAVALEVDGTDFDTVGLPSRSMQLRKLKAAALVTSDLSVAKEFVKEQATAAGNFPGPCPVIYNGKDINEAVELGVSGVITSTGVKVEGNVDIIHKVSTREQVASIVCGSAYLVDADTDGVEEILGAIPSGSVVIASVKSMQNDNAELATKALKDLGVTAVLMENAIIGDNEDLEYASFAIDGFTKKRSSTFNMSGNIDLCWYRPCTRLGIVLSSFRSL